MKFKWVKTQSTHAQILNCDHKLPAIAPVTMTGLIPKDNSLNREIFDTLHAIHGLEDFCTSGGYKIDVQKGAVFSWDEVKPRVEQALISIFEPSHEQENICDTESTDSE